MPADPQSSGSRMPIGLMVAGSEMASFTLLGLLLDFSLGTMPGFTIGLTILGLAAAFYHLVKMAKVFAEKKSTPPGAQPPTAGGES